MIYVCNNSKKYSVKMKIELLAEVISTCSRLVKGLLRVKLRNATRGEWQEEEVDNIYEILEHDDDPFKYHNFLCKNNQASSPCCCVGVRLSDFEAKYHENFLRHVEFAIVERGRLDVASHW